MRRVLAGEASLPLPIANQLACCLYACGRASAFIRRKRWWRWRSRASRQIIDRFLRTRGEAAANCSARMSGTSAAGHDIRDVETLSGAYI
jgi:hypothetical protein